jgi:hypothetical protein
MSPKTNLIKSKAKGEKNELYTTFNINSDNNNYTSIFNYTKKCFINYMWNNIITYRINYTSSTKNKIFIKKNS